MAVFKMEVRDLQISMFQGNAFNLTNAGRTDGNGAEIDLIWQLPFPVLYLLLLKSGRFCRYIGFVCLSLV